jgi:hypothetical protein
MLMDLRFSDLRKLEGRSQKSEGEYEEWRIEN